MIISANVFNFQTLSISVSSVLIRGKFHFISCSLPTQNDVEPEILYSVSIFFDSNKSKMTTHIYALF